MIVTFPISRETRTNLLSQREAAKLKFGLSGLVC
jgi:hypothetical protein